jgi:hypothetical protein
MGTEKIVRRSAALNSTASRPQEGVGGLMPGQGFLFGGTAHILSSGNVVDKVKPKFPLARGAIVAAL